MKIISPELSEYEFLQKYIEPVEYSCVQLASFIRKQDEHIFAVIKTQSISSEKDIIGVFFLNRVLVHCVSGFFNLTESQQNELKQLLNDFFADKTIKCIDGEAEGSDFFYSILINSKTLLQENVYSLMTLTETPLLPPESLSLDAEIRRCTEDDFDLLFETQKMYIAKEVAPQGKSVSEAEVSITLRQILKNQLCFALFSDGDLVAKANTNAIGWKWVQLGGIFTHPLYRRNYYAWNLVVTICNRVIKRGRNLCLFVKEKNIPARKLYSRIGFKDSGIFKIIYLN